jgi:hypothetical protein
MKRIKIRELPNWPPQPGGTNSDRPAPNQVSLTTVEPKQVDGLVTFVGEFQRKPLTYDYTASSETLAEAIREALRSNLGTSIGDLDVELELSEKSAA